MEYYTIEWREWGKDGCDPLCYRTRWHTTCAASKAAAIEDCLRHNGIVSGTTGTIYSSRTDFSFDHHRETPPRKMTVAEVSEKLGYDVEIVKG